MLAEIQNVLQSAFFYRKLKAFMHSFLQSCDTEIVSVKNTDRRLSWKKNLV